MIIGFAYFLSIQKGHIKIINLAADENQILSVQMFGQCEGF